MTSVKVEPTTVIRSGHNVGTLKLLTALAMFNERAPK